MKEGNEIFSNLIWSYWNRIFSCHICCYLNWDNVGRSCWFDTDLVLNKRNIRSCRVLQRNWKLRLMEIDFSDYLPRRSNYRFDCFKARFKHIPALLLSWAVFKVTRIDGACTCNYEALTQWIFRVAHVCGRRAQNGNRWTTCAGIEFIAADLIRAVLFSRSFPPDVSCLLLDTIQSETLVRDFLEQIDHLVNLFASFFVPPPLVLLKLESTLISVIKSFISISYFKLFYDMDSHLS